MNAPSAYPVHVYAIQNGDGPLACEGIARARNNSCSCSATTYISLYSNHPVPISGHVAISRASNFLSQLALASVEEAIHMDICS